MRHRAKAPGAGQHIRTAGAGGAARAPAPPPAPKGIAFILNKMIQTVHPAAQSSHHSMYPMLGAAAPSHIAPVPSLRAPA